VSAGGLDTVSLVKDPNPERTPAEILEDYSKQSLERINKIDRWVRKVTYGLLGMMAVLGATIVVGFVVFDYLIDEIDQSRYDSALKSCQANRQATHDGLASLMESLAETDAQKDKAQLLADTYFPTSGCEQFVDSLGLAP
jgi:hypothetical protein